ncbi:MAG TPA: serine hydrolase [Pyrinomonadaceae bacterium]|jgi:CubicO group peptidase (beta-lactamase class C family)|nr:serine hydrolase [Pyrinomonadaceae bacterium]
MQTYDRRCLAFLLFITVFVAVVPAQNASRNVQFNVRSSKSAALPRTSPEQQGISSADLLAFVEAADKEIDAMNSFMLIRHGAVVAEGWWGPYDRDTPHILYSLSKSFTSTAVGLAISEGKLSLDDQVLKFFPEEAPAEPSVNLRAMRVRDLLRMNTGNQTEAPIRVDDPEKQKETWVKTFLTHPVPFKPGTHFLYNSPATYMLSAIVHKVTGQTVLDYLRPRLFEQLGFKDPQWITSPQGISVGAYGLSLRTEEIARFGQLYLQKGMWNGKQLLPASWVEQATSMQTSNGSAPTSDWDQGYGYQFWRSRHNSFRGDGAFGQYCMVIPELDAVVAITSGVRSMQQVMNLVWEKLLPVMKAGRLPENATARRQLEARLAGLTLKLPNGVTGSRVSSSVSGKWFELADNDRGLKAVSIDFNAESPTLKVRTATGETQTAIGMGLWAKSRGSFTNGLDHALSVPGNPLTAASGAWSEDETFTVKIVLYETPYYSTVNFKFDGDRLVIDSEHNVFFGSTKLPQLVGQLRGSE